MNIYWFTDENGHYWHVIVAKDEEEAWNIFSQNSLDEETVEELKKEYELHQTTVIGDKSGEVAYINQPENDFYVNKEPEID